MKLNILKTSIILTSLLLPVAAFADNVITNVGEGVADTAVGVGNAVEDVVDGTAKGVKKIVGANGSSSKPMSDSTVSTNVRTKLKDLSKDGKIDSHNSLDVKTSKGVVTVSGNVANEDDIATIKQAVSAEPGVKSVTVNLVVKPVL
jgi:osmotically-inducible protein OsmY